LSGKLLQEGSIQCCGWALLCRKSTCLLGTVLQVPPGLITKPQSLAYFFPKDAEQASDCGQHALQTQQMGLYVDVQHACHWLHDVGHIKLWPTHAKHVPAVVLM